MSADGISVIICAYAQKRWPNLVAAVVSLQNQTLAAREIIVVIDHNQELFQQVQARFPEVTVIENREARGLSGARNSGIAVAKGEFLAFLDDDAIAKPDWLAQLQSALVDTRVLGVGGAVVPDWAGPRPTWFPSEFQWVVGCTYVGMPRVSAPIRNPVGANMCLRREVFQAVGGFHNGIGRVGTLPVGCEETELCIRARQYWSERFFLYIPQAQVSHYVPPQRATWRYFCTRCYAEGRSKAAISRLVGTKDALSSESTYTLWTLPIGVLCNLYILLFKHRPAAFLRAVAIIFGLSITATGYLIGKYEYSSSSMYKKE
ncbi:MAG TPA: glycosyltransferase family 2 protein [Ktedonobacteraceae bacterium]|nr:glycosyltransferase family 2 protein [Ktedonobacteraceae bacterium]